MRFKKRTLVSYDPNELQGLIDSSRAGDCKATEEILKRCERYIISFTCLIKDGKYNASSFSQRYFLSLFSNKDSNEKLRNVAKAISKEFVGVNDEEISFMVKKAILQAIQDHDKNMIGKATSLLRADVASLLGTKISEVLNLENLEDCLPTNDFYLDEVDLGLRIGTLDSTLSWAEKKRLRHKFLHKL